MGAYWILLYPAMVVGFSWLVRRSRIGSFPIAFGNSVGTFLGLLLMASGSVSDHQAGIEFLLFTALLWPVAYFSKK